MDCQLAVRRERAGVVDAVEVEDHPLARRLQLVRHEGSDGLGSRPVRDREDLGIAHAERERRDEGGEVGPCRAHGSLLN